ncbi:MAG: CAP domain-containing protein [Oscillospiraceae bacterium]|nr:CAP domain-containing protein [Oscillospiraceae bacterium]
MKHDKKNITTMVTGIAIGAVLVSEAAAGIVAEPTWQKIYVDGQQVSMTAYNIAGHNYVRLRDIGQQVGFNVYWEDGVQIDTGAPYTGVAPAQKISTQPTDMEIREEMIQRINEVRRKHGAPELAVDQSLMDAAQECSAQMFTSHHNQVECKTVAASGYPHGFGSNLTAFTVMEPEKIPQKAVANWENSPGHLATMIAADCNTIGVGVTVDNGRTFCYMFVGNPTANNPYA